MIRSLATCEYRQFSPNTSVCRHPDNAALMVSLKECVGCRLMIVRDETHRELTPHAVPLADWPHAARVMRCLRRAGDTGVGDTIERELGRVGGLFKWAMDCLAIECGCARRRDHLNGIYPYETVSGQSAGQKNLLSPPGDT